METKAVINMTFYRLRKILPFVFTFIFVVHLIGRAQNEDQLPVREYTNPNEVVTFDRTTSFSRALDVINQFAQKYRNKMIINRTDTEGNIGISVPPMHWMDALKLILNVKKLALVEQKDYYEIVTPASLKPQSGSNSNNNPSVGNSKNGKGPLATTHSKEVRIKAIFFEGNKRALQEIGVDWSTISENVPDAVLGGGSGGQSGGSGGGGQSNSPQIPNSSFNGPFVQVNSKGAQSVSQDVFNSLINFGEVGNSGIRVQALFSAFEADNLGQILASPNIKVLDGQQGRIQVGQDFSIKQRDFSGNVIDKFFSVGTILEVTPTVIEQNDTTFIHLDINAQRSNAQPDPVSTVINKQQAQTQALLLDGESTVIAGLYNTESTEVRKGIPILKDLPPWFFGLRYLFGYNSKDLQTRELVILIKASLEPTIPARVAKEGQFKDGYEVLHNERQNMEKEVKRGQQILNGKLKKQRPESEEKDTTSNKPKKKMSESKDTPKPKAEQKEEPQKQNMAMKENPQPASPDPEIHAQKIQLNLGGQKQETAPTSAKDTMQAPQAKSINNTAKKYYIIGGSFRKEDNARDFRDKLKKKGFDSMILQKDEFTFVAYQQFEDLDSAKTAISEIQQHQNPDAWLYVSNK